jgi:hypothetical protein
VEQVEHAGFEQWSDHQAGRERQSEERQRLGSVLSLSRADHGHEDGKDEPAAHAEADGSGPEVGAVTREGEEYERGKAEGLADCEEPEAAARRDPRYDESRSENPGDAGCRGDHADGAAGQIEQLPTDQRIGCLRHVLARAAEHGDGQKER